MFIQFFIDWWRGDGLLGAQRSSQWQRIRREYHDQNPLCAVCNTRKKIEIHHKHPFHLNPELELDKNNLISLCKEHHFWFGHLGSYQSFNEEVEKDAVLFSAKIRSRP